MGDTRVIEQGAIRAEVAPPLLNPGQVFHGLRVHSLLGEGAMGYAYLASHPVLAAPVVIKTFKPTASTSLFAEASLAARASSPHVVAVLDAGAEAGVVFTVQRYVDGIDLGELVRRWYEAGRRVPVGVACRLLLDAARGLWAIHLAGVVHRDIKLENLFLRGDGTAAIGDFGVALDWSDQAGMPVAGTPLFMAPEQWLGDPVDGRADIYALGVVGCLLSTGRSPFRAVTREEIRAAHTEEEHTMPPAEDPRQAYLYAVIQRMMKRRPEDRYPSAGALVRALEPIAEPSLPILAAGADRWHIGEIEVMLRVGDIADASACVIVNAANTDLAMRVGVAAALRRAGGEAIAAEAEARAPAKMGDVIWTGAGALKARWVAHAVAALAGAICVARCTLRVLIGAEAREAGSVAIPALGTGVGGVPMALGAKLMLEAMRTFAALGPARVQRVEVVLFDEPAAEAWRMVLRAMCG